MKIRQMPGQRAATNLPAKLRQWFPEGEVICETITKKGEALTVRRFRRGDQEAVFRVHEKALRSVDGYDYDERAKGNFCQDMEDVESNYLTGRNDFLVAVVNGKIAGCGALFERKDREPSIAELTRIRVDPDYFGRGIGRALRQARCKVAIRHGFTRAYSDTSFMQKASVKLHEKDDWKLIRVCDNEWSIRHNTVIVCFEKNLI